jgi:hypothetical protein
MVQEQDQSLQEKPQKDEDVNHILETSMEILLGQMALQVVKVEDYLNQAASLLFPTDPPERRR